MNFVEEWRPCPGFELTHAISCIGRIKRTRRAKATRVGRILTPCLDKGYMRVGLGGRALKVHRLVTTAFHGPSYGRHVNHIDGNKWNNCATNLEWCSQAENNAHAGRLGLKPRGTDHFRSKLVESDVILIRFFKKRGMTAEQIKEKLAKPIGLNTIRGVWNRDAWGWFQ